MAYKKKLLIQTSIKHTSKTRNTIRSRKVFAFQQLAEVKRKEFLAHPQVLGNIRKRLRIDNYFDKVKAIYSEIMFSKNFKHWKSTERWLKLARAEFLLEHAKYEDKDFQDFLGDTWTLHSDRDTTKM